MKKKLLKKAGLAITFLAFITTVAAQEKTTEPSKKTAAKNRYLNVENDSNGAPGQQIINYRDQQEFKITMTNDTVTGLIIDDKKIPETDFYKYEPVIKKIRQQIKKDQEMAESDRKQAGKDREQAEEDRKMAEHDRKQANADREQAGKDREQAGKDEIQTGKDREQAEEDRKTADTDRKQADADREQAVSDREQAKKDRVQAEEDRKQAVLDRKQAEEDRVLVKNLVNDLIKENIIKAEKDLFSLVLKEGALLVNDEKQPDTIYQKFKNKYLKNAQREIRFNNSVNHHELSVY